MQTSKEYEIAKPQLPLLQEQFATLNKKAAKLGCIPITMEILGERIEIITCPEHRVVQGNNIQLVAALDEVRIFVKVCLTGDIPKYEGWTFAATVQHLPATQSSEAFDIIRTIPGVFEIPAQYRDKSRAQICDHCQTNRYRRDTFIIHHDNGTWKQVGRQCLKDFLGHKDPHALAAQAELFINALTLLEDTTRQTNGYKGWDCFNLESYLKWVAGVIRVRGWLSRSNAQARDQQATADFVYELISPISICDSQYAKRMEQLYEQANPTEQDIELTAKAIEWAAQLDPGKNDYLYNIHTIAKAGMIDRRLIGYAASIIPAYQREVEKAKVQQTNSLTSKHLGTVGKREVFTLMIEKMVNLDGVYPSTLYVFKDAEGNQAIWFASKKSGFQVGDVVNVKASVKEHKERNGTAQTVLTRVQKES